MKPISFKNLTLNGFFWLHNYCFQNLKVYNPCFRPLWMHYLSQSDKSGEYTPNLIQSVYFALAFTKKSNGK